MTSTTAHTSASTAQPTTTAATAPAITTTSTIGTASPTTGASGAGGWNRAATAGRVLTGLLVVFLLVDAGGKLVRADVAVTATEQLGFGADQVVLIGALLLVGVVLHLVPRTALIGAVYLSAYLGGAVAAHVRTDNIGSVAFTVTVALTLWAGFALREPAVLELALGRSPRRRR